MISSNRLSRYMIYAIGEILLVVIGILIALQVNNWNEGRFQRAEEKRILSNIREEVEQAISSRESIREIYQSRQALLSSALDKLYSDKIISLTVEECYALFQSHMTNWTPFNISTLEELVTSGKLSVLSNDELRNLLLSFRNLTMSNVSRVEKAMYEAIVLVDQYPIMIERNWNIPSQNSIFECQAGKMKSNQRFLAHLQSNQGRMRTPISVAAEELIVLRKISTQIDEEMNGL